jgi:Calcium binding
MVVSTSKYSIPPRSLLKESNLLPAGDLSILDPEHAIRVMKEMNRIIDKEILIQENLDNWSKQGCWHFFVNECLSFPFRARVPIRKVDGTVEKHVLDVNGPADKRNNGLKKNSAFVNVDYNGLLMKFDVYELEPINMSDEMLRILQLWQFKQQGIWTIFNIDV